MADKAPVSVLPAFQPAHPGEILREDILPRFDISKAELARHLGVSRETLYKILNEERSVTADVAARLARALGTSVAFWLNLQANFDAWHAERDPAVRKITPLSRKAA